MTEPCCTEQCEVAAEVHRDFGCCNIWITVWESVEGAWRWQQHLQLWRGTGCCC